MDQQLLRQRTITGSAIFMIAGTIILAASIFILATGVGSSHGLGGTSISTPGYSLELVPFPLVALSALSIPSIPLGAMLFLIGLANTTKKPSLRWLRSSANILCSIVLGIAVLWALVISVLLFSGF